MGNCHLCYEENPNQTFSTIKTLNLKAGPQFNGINFSFTNKPITELKGDCLVFYADYIKQLTENQSLNAIHRKTKRKIFEYLTLAEQQSQRTHMKHYLIPISISSLGFKYLLFVKIEPWDGHSKNKIEKKIYNMTVGYMESFRLRKIKDFTIIELDIFSGIHYSIGFPPIAKAIQEYSSDIKCVNIVCNSVQSVDYYYENIRSVGKIRHEFRDDKKEGKNKSVNKKVAVSQNKLLY